MLIIGGTAPRAHSTDNKNATAFTEYSVTYGIDISNNSRCQMIIRPEKAAHYTQRFAVLQESCIPSLLPVT